MNERILSGEWKLRPEALAEPQCEIEERRRRLARQQFWFGVRRELDRVNNAWIALFAGLMGVLVGLLLAGALGAR